MAVRIDIKDMQSIAAHYGGKCLSKEYINSNSSLEWMCEKGHTWDADYEIVRQGGWCVQCAKGQKKKEEQLEKIKALAEKKGGKCLSTEYINNKSRLEFECAEGHRWKAKPNNITASGSWCLICSSKQRGKKRRDGIEIYYKIAKKHGGKCLSTEYSNTNTKLKFECAQGHTFFIVPASLKAGYWCKQCNKNIVQEKVLNELKIIAEKKNGILLSKKYSHTVTQLKWQCAKGHIFLLAPRSIQNGAWCPQCYKKQEKEKVLNIIKSVAEKQGGKCLSSIYKNKYSILKWQCKNGHKWAMQASNVSKGEWCKLCKRNEICDKELKKLNAIAEKHGGKCLSSKFIRTDLELQWQCSKGHIFLSLPKTIKKGHWCRFCNRKIGGEKQRKYTIDKLQEYAQKHGGNILSTEYINESKPLIWQCSKGHIWSTTPHIVDRGIWYCPGCKGKNNIKLTIEELQLLAKQQGGELLSQKYINKKTPLKWKCSEGHVWLSQAGSIKSGSWCHICANKKRGDALRGSIETYHKIAAEKGGKCVSTEYINSKSKLEFQCAEGHHWKSIANDIHQGHWCPLCANKKRDEKLKDTIETYFKIALEKGGKCLSTQYINSISKLEFECAEGHRWSTTASSVKQGSWCSKCFYKKKN